jgi:hypothetical protein
MSAPVEPPEGYLFSPNALSWDNPSTSGIVWEDAGDRQRVVLVHEVCGCFVSVGNLETHNAWHSALGG